MICAVSCFYNRYTCVTRILRQYLLQDYKGPSTLLLYNNGPQVYELAELNLPAYKDVILVNNNKDLQTGEDYTNTGDIFRDALTFAPECDIITFMDVDDFYSPRHLSLGVQGMEQALINEQLAYKSYYAYHKYLNNLTKDHNSHEPSIFVDATYVRAQGFHPVASSYHQKWLTPLQKQKKILQPDSEITFFYYWGGDDNCYKVSGKGDTQENFDSLRTNEKDVGSNVIMPCSPEEMQKYYNQVGWSLE